MSLEATPHRRLPVVLSPTADELLSSWIGRHAAFYGVPPITMLQYCLAETSSVRAADLYLTDEQAVRIAQMVGSDPGVVRRMTFAQVTQTSRRLIAARPLQSCSKCMSGNGDPTPIRRCQLLGWRLTCSLCGSPLRNGDSDEHEAPSPFRHYLSVALHGERLIDDEAEQGNRTWASPIDIARLLLMRRDPKTLRPDKRTASPRILGVVVPEFDATTADSRKPLPSAASPILPLRLRPALLAGVAIVERHGPSMLEMLHSHTIGENRTRFGKLVSQMLGQGHSTPRPAQLQLI